MSLSQSRTGSPATATALMQKGSAYDDRGKLQNALLADWFVERRDKHRNAVGDPDYDPRTLYIPDAEYKKMTPGQSQYWQIKSENMDIVLFFKMGKFYELFDEVSDLFLSCEASFSKFSKIHHHLLTRPHPFSTRTHPPTRAGRRDWRARVGFGLYDRQGAAARRLPRGRVRQVRGTVGAPRLQGRPRRTGITNRPMRFCNPFFSL